MKFLNFPLGRPGVSILDFRNFVDSARLARLDFVSGVYGFDFFSKRPGVDFVERGALVYYKCCYCCCPIDLPRETCVVNIMTSV